MSHYRGHSRVPNNSERAQRIRRPVRISALGQEAHSGFWDDGNGHPDNDPCIQGFVAHALDILVYAHILYDACTPNRWFCLSTPPATSFSAAILHTTTFARSVFCFTLHRQLKLSHGRIRQSFVSSLHIPAQSGCSFRVYGFLKEPFDRLAVQSLSCSAWTRPSL